MSKWICVDDICIPSDDNDWEELVAFADAIAEQEPIDLVYCFECKYSKRMQVSPLSRYQRYCDRHADPMAVENGEFCCWGDRREDE